MADVFEGVEVFAFPRPGRETQLRIIPSPWGDVDRVKEALLGPVQGTVREPALRQDRMGNEALATDPITGQPIIEERDLRPVAEISDTLVGNSFVCAPDRRVHEVLEAAGVQVREVTVYQQHLSA